MVIGIVAALLLVPSVAVGAAATGPTVKGVSQGAANAVHIQPHNVPSPVATYEWFYNNGGGFQDGGQLTINSGNTWSAVSFGDGGTWIQSGKTISLEDNVGGDGSDGFIEIGTIGKHGISSATKPGNWVAPEGGGPGTFYLVKL